ncbi:tetratricopeptide repeat protein [Massilia sp. PWRC2]|uniref:tetratricopeptide repeat protein n=1 Tax=Massilia sp. PWRC2 TaxID=2804626 RepID=UPI003CE737DB
MKNAFVIVTLAGVLTACGTAGPVPVPAAAAVVPVPAAAAAAAAANGNAAPAAIAAPAWSVERTTPVTAEPVALQADPQLPNVALTSELLYKLMVAEIDFKNGNWQGPFMVMMGAAQQTRDPRLAQRATEIALASQQGEPTLAAVRLWRELAPQSDEAAQYYLGIVVLSDDISDAEGIFRSRLAAAAGGDRALLMFQTQQLLGRAKDKAAASAMLERLVAPYSRTLEGHLVLAQAAFGRGDKARASVEAQAALALKPDSEIAVLMVAQVSADEAAAQALLGRFLKAHPNAREVRAAHARLLAGARQFGPAREELRTLLKGQPDNLSTLYALGIVSLQMNDSASAESYLQRFADAASGQSNGDIDTARAYSLLSQLAEERGDSGAALAWLDKIDDDERGWFAAQLRRAQLLGKRGDVDGARALLAKLATSTEAEQAQIVLADAQVLREAGRLQDAYVLLQTALTTFPGNADVLYDVAMLAEKMGRLDDMEQALRKVIAQVPDHHQAYNALGYSLAERNIRLPEALELITKALQMAPDDPFIMDSMGWVQFRMGNLNAAEKQLRQAYALRSDAEIAVHLGEVLWQKGQQADARKLWREALNKDPKNDTLKSTLARLRTSI